MKRISDSFFSSNIPSPPKKRELDSFSYFYVIFRGGSRTAATYKMELFVVIVNGFQKDRFV